jgi:hypothetical protein
MLAEMHLVRCLPQICKDRNNADALFVRLNVVMRRMETPGNIKQNPRPSKCEELGPFEYEIIQDDEVRDYR